MTKFRLIDLITNHGCMKTVTLYILVLAVFGLGIWLTFEQGQKLGSPLVSNQQPAKLVSQTDSLNAGPSAGLFMNLRTNLQDPLPRLFLQLIIVLFVARMAGVLAAKFRQPAVIGEMIAGILLGPVVARLAVPGYFPFHFSRIVARLAPFVEPNRRVPVYVYRGNGIEYD
jgi:hypothetical protein